eukprot:4534336-Pyramimonas_sp.AAC.1
MRRPGMSLAPVAVVPRATWKPCHTHPQGTRKWPNRRATPCAALATTCQPRHRHAARSLTQQGRNVLCRRQAIGAELRHSLDNETWCPTL